MNFFDTRSPITASQLPYRLEDDNGVVVYAAPTERHTSSVSFSYKLVARRAMASPTERAETLPGYVSIALEAGNAPPVLNPLQVLAAAEMACPHMALLV